jgi:hypothetical protein
LSIALCLEAVVLVAVQKAGTAHTTAVIASLTQRDNDDL